MSGGDARPASAKVSGIGDSLPPVARSSGIVAWWFPVRIYYEDTDAAGIVYYANYLRFMERARTEWLRELGCEIDELARRQKVLFAVRSVEVDYHHPCRLNDRLQVGVSVERARAASIDLRQPVFRGETAVVTGRVRLACLDAESFKPRPLPKSLQEKLTAKA